MFGVVVVAGSARGTPLRAFHKGNMMGAECRLSRPLTDCRGNAIYTVHSTTPFDDALLKAIRDISGVASVKFLDRYSVEMRIGSLFNEQMVSDQVVRLIEAPPTPGKENPPVLGETGGPRGGETLASYLAGLSAEQLREAVLLSLNVADYCNEMDSSDFKQWVIDQMVRRLTGPYYPKWVAAFETGEDAPQTYRYDTGTAP